MLQYILPDCQGGTAKVPSGETAGKACGEIEEEGTACSSVRDVGKRGIGGSQKAD